MAANGRGSLRPSHNQRTPPFLLIGLLVVIAILGFNYWSASSKNNDLHVNVRSMEDKMKTSAINAMNFQSRIEQMVQSGRQKDQMIDKLKAELDTKIRELDTNVRRLERMEIDAKTTSETCRDDLNTARSNYDDIRLELVGVESLPYPRVACCDKFVSLVTSWIPTWIWNLGLGWIGVSQ